MRRARQNRRALAADRAVCIPDTIWLSPKETTSDPNSAVSADRRSLNSAGPGNMSAWSRTRQSSECLRGSPSRSGEGWYALALKCRPRRHSALFAWRRADVTDLNRLARHHWDQLGHLHGDDIEIAPRRWYAVGDQLVALAPNPRAGIVTSERLTVTAVDDDHLDAHTSDGRHVRITGDGLDAEHLDYGYTLTVHRAQGATVDRAHVLAGGGGRELAYVALSRARQQTRIYATADNLHQAVDDLNADWTQAHHQRWIIDTSARAGHELEPKTRPTHEPPIEISPSQQRVVAHTHLTALEDDYRQLRAGTGRWANTLEGHTHRALTEAKKELQQAHHIAHDARYRRRDRRAAAKSIPELEPSSLERKQSTNRCAHRPSRNCAPTSALLAPRSNTSTPRPPSDASKHSAIRRHDQHSSPTSESPYDPEGCLAPRVRR